MKAKYSFIDESGDLVNVYKYRGFEYPIKEKRGESTELQHKIERNKIDLFLLELNEWYKESSEYMYENDIEKMEI